MIASFLCSVFVSLSLFSPAHAATPDPVTTLRRVETFLNNISTLTADFIQISPDGSSAEGKMFLKRPGNMRWQYAPPTPILMIANNNVLTYYDFELDQTSQLSLDDSLAGFLARPNIKLDDEALRIINFREGNGSIRFTILQTNKQDEGSLTLEFSDSPLKIENMIVADATGQVTTIKLQKTQYEVPLSQSLFTYQDPRKPRERGHRR